MIRSVLFFILVGFLSVAAVVKKKDVVTETQTDPIPYQEKVREEAEGKKSPPAPALVLYPRQRFLEEGPVGKPKVPWFAVKESPQAEEGEGEEIWEEENTESEESPSEPEEGGEDWEWVGVKPGRDSDDTGEYE